MPKRILFLGESYRADAQTWIAGLREFGHFEVDTWEMRNDEGGLKRVFRLLEYLGAVRSVRQAIRRYKPDMVIAERCTSYGYLAVASGFHPVAVAQQGITDAWPPGSPLMPLKTYLEQQTFNNADLLHAWGEVMADHMRSRGVDMRKVWVMPKGIDLRVFQMAEPPADRLRAVVTRSLSPVYDHATILRAFALLPESCRPFELTVVGDGPLRKKLEQLCVELDIASMVRFTGRLSYQDLPSMLQQCNLYISMPHTEGVSASLLEAMACGCFPIVSDIPGNRQWIKDGINGLLVKTGHAQKLSDAIGRAWANQTWRRETARANRLQVEQEASYEVNMRRMADRYHEIIASFQNANRHEVV